MKVVTGSSENVLIMREQYDTIVYHGGCLDGWCAAYIAKKVHPKAAMFPVVHGGPFPNLKHRRVLMVDFSLSKERMLALAAQTSSLTCLDHHASAHELIGVYDCHIDMTKSGARLTWEHFHPKEPAPWWVLYVEDRDLWKFNLRHSREVSAFLHMQPHTEEVWDLITSGGPLSEHSMAKVVNQGGGALQHARWFAARMLELSTAGLWGRWRVRVANTPAFMASDVGEAIYSLSDVDLAVMWCERPDGLVQFSLRSKTVDCATLAQVFNGGGHKSAAGFQLHKPLARALLDQIQSSEGLRS